MNLHDKVTALPFVGPSYAKKLKKLNIETISDLLEHLPNRYLDYSKSSDLTNLQPGDEVTIIGEVSMLKNQYTKSGRQMQLVEITSKNRKILCVWFNQPFILRNFKKGETVAVAGKVDWFGRSLALISPEFEPNTASNVHTGRLVPIYPQTAGVSSKWLRRRIADAFRVFPEFEEFLAEELENLDLLEINSAIKKVHYPLDEVDAQLARKRLAFNELFLLQAQNIKRRLTWEQKTSAHQIARDTKLLEDFISKLPFELTQSQLQSIEEVLKDIQSSTPMNRLLQGDVGSGKTMVAAAAALTAFSAGVQTIIMAPTQILAQQHYQTFTNIFSQYNVRLSLYISGEKIISPGKSDVIIGTHSLLYQENILADAALIVIDEQHRFGVKQRATLSEARVEGDKFPHVLTMTATPIPRSAALTLYGDLELSLLRELPKNRKVTKTWIVPPAKREAAYEWIEGQIKKTGCQAFVICPLIEESESESLLQVKAATVEYKNLKKLLPSLKFGLLHGKIKGKEKEKIIADFRAKKFDILVSTPVVEVGIDIPNASIIVIEASERFGLSQLHQLRGRVGRNNSQAYCLLFSENKNANTNKRLKAMIQTHSGFELSEIDLKLRGPGEVFGVRQSGEWGLRFADWTDIDLIKKSKEFAQKVFDQPDKYKKIFAYLQRSMIARN